MLDYISFIISIARTITRQALAENGVDFSVLKTEIPKRIRAIVMPKVPCARGSDTLCSPTQLSNQPRYTLFEPCMRIDQYCNMRCDCRLISCILKLYPPAHYRSRLHPSTRD